MKSIELKNNETILINGKIYLVGECLFNDDFNLHCIDKYVDKGKWIPKEQQ